MHWDFTLSVVKDFDKPTPIQSQCWPIIGSGRDIIGIAETGSGKTLAYALPMLAHLDTHLLGQGLQALVVTPTRELAVQTTRVLQNLTGKGKANKKGHIDNYIKDAHKKAGAAEDLGGALVR